MPRFADATPDDAVCRALRMMLPMRMQMMRRYMPPRYGASEICSEAKMRCYTRRVLCYAMMFNDATRRCLMPARIAADESTYAAKIMLRWRRAMPPITVHAASTMLPDFADAADRHFGFRLMPFQLFSPHISI